MVTCITTTAAEEEKERKKERKHVEKNPFRKIIFEIHFMFCAKLFPEHVSCRDVSKNSFGEALYESQKVSLQNSNSEMHLLCF